MTNGAAFILISVFATLFGFLCGWLIGFKRAIEAKLKEKNHG